MLGKLDWEEVKKGSQSAEAEISYKSAVERETSEAQRLAEILQEHQREREETRHRDRLAGYLKERWSSARDEHQRRSKSRYLYWILSALFFISATAAAISVFEGIKKDVSAMLVMLLLFAVCLLLSLRGVNSRKAAQALEKERWSFEGKTGDYAGLEPEEGFSRFVAKVDWILSHSTWFGLLGKTSHETVRMPEEVITEAVGNNSETVSAETDDFLIGKKETESYDVFVSYRQGYLSTNWVREFLPLFTAWLSEFLGRDPKLISGPSVHANVSDEVAEERAQRARRALDDSQCMVAIVTPAYFQSESCMNEWKSFSEKTQRRIFPIVLQRGEFPSPTHHVQWMDFSSYALLGEGFRKTAVYVDFQREVRKLAEAAAEAITAAPFVHPRPPDV